MSENLDELLKLASNAGHETRDDAPQGLQIGDLCSNGYAANRNPRKLFMYVQTLRDSIYGLSIDGQDVYVVRSANRVALVLPRDTPNYWRTWELLTKQLPLVSLVLAVLLSGCLTPAKLTSMSQRADVLSQGAKTKACADAAANAASAVVVALEDMTRATKMSDPVRSPARDLRLAEVACLECVKDTDCATGEECVGGHCQKRRK